MEEIVITIFRPPLGLAHVLLVFVGFIYSHGEASRVISTETEDQNRCEITPSPVQRVDCGKAVLPEMAHRADSIDYAVSLSSFESVCSSPCLRRSRAAVYPLSETRNGPQRRVKRELEDKSFPELFNDKKQHPKWVRLAQRAYDYVMENMTQGKEPR